VMTYYIRDISITGGLVLAPMSGVTCSSFRRLIKELNPDTVGLMLSEFVSVEGMTRKIKKTLDMMKFHEMERPYGIQIFGYDPKRMADAAKMCEDFGVDLVDINCGCPAPKVVRKGGGCELMRQPDHLKTIFNTVRKSIKVPLTMKMRSGWDAQSKNCLEIAHIAESEGVEGITIHGRTRSDLYRGVADWSFITAAKSNVKIPVCGSGDVVSKQTAEEKMQSGADGLFIGRGAIENPWIFTDIIKGKISERTNSEYLAVIERYKDLLLEEFPEKAASGKLKQLVSQMVKGQQWRKSFLIAPTFEAQMKILSELKQSLENS
jgi:tRNA-dihydrouridine synthase B